MAAFAAEEDNLQQTIRLLPEVLEQANPALDALNASFPPTRAFAREILPGVRETPATIEASFPWIEQVRALVSPAELQGLVNDLRPAVDDLAQLTDDIDRAAPEGRRRQPLLHRERPADGRHRDRRADSRTDGRRELQGVLAEPGRALRREPELRRQRPVHALPAGRRHADAVDRQRRDIGGPPLFGNPNLPPLGSIPKYPARKPPYRRDVECYTNALPKVNENAVGGRPGHEARDPKAPARLHRDPLPGRRRPSASAGYILSNQRFYLPAWVPGIGTDFYKVKAEFETGQAVVPGQGQTVNIAGVKVGDIGEVELENGVAVVELKIQDKYTPIYRDATMLLRPKTGLKDMFVELDPGTQAAGELPEGGRSASRRRGRT